MFALMMQLICVSCIVHGSLEAILKHALEDAPKQAVAMMA